MSTPATLRIPRSADPAPTRTRLRTRRVPAAVPLALSLLLLVAVVGAAQLAGFWSTSGRTTGVAASSSTTGEPATEKDTSSVPVSPEDVKGWMTLDQVVRAGFPGVTEAALRAQFAIPADVALTTPLKDLEAAAPGFEVTALREWLAAR
jgi:hypothetical protein